MSTNWLCNYAIVQATIPGIENLGYKFWIIWVSLNNSRPHNSHSRSDPKPDSGRLAFAFPSSQSPISSTRRRRIEVWKTLIASSRRTRLLSFAATSWPRNYRGLRYMRNRTRKSTGRLESMMSPQVAAMGAERFRLNSVLRKWDSCGGDSTDVEGLCEWTGWQRWCNTHICEMVIGTNSLASRLST